MISVEELNETVPPPELVEELDKIALEEVGPKDIAVGDWAVIQFPLQNTKDGSKSFIGKVLEKKNDEYRFDCLRKKISTEFPGYVYSYPQVRDDETWFSRAQISYLVSDPEPYGRGLLKFTVNV